MCRGTMIKQLDYNSVIEVLKALAISEDDYKTAIEKEGIGEVSVSALNCFSGLLLYLKGEFTTALRYFKDSDTRMVTSLNGGITFDIKNWIKAITGQELIENIENVDGKLFANVDGEKIEINPQNSKKLKNRPFELGYTKENLLQLKDFKNISITVGYIVEGGAHLFSLEFNEDGTVTLYEPQDSRTGKKYEIDELFKLANRNNFVVTVL